MAGGNKVVVHAYVREQAATLSIENKQTNTFVAKPCLRCSLQWYVYLRSSKVLLSPANGSFLLLYSFSGHF